MGEVGRQEVRERRDSESESRVGRKKKKKKTKKFHVLTISPGSDCFAAKRPFRDLADHTEVITNSASEEPNTNCLCYIFFLKCNFIGSWLNTIQIIK